MQASIIEMSEHSGQSSPSLDSMFRLRHEVFKERLKWDVGSMSGQERDNFDRAIPKAMVMKDVKSGQGL